MTDLAKWSSKAAVSVCLVNFKRNLDMVHRRLENRSESALVGLTTPLKCHRDSKIVFYSTSFLLWSVKKPPEASNQNMEGEQKVLSFAEHPRTKVGEGTFISIVYVSKDGAILQERGFQTIGRIFEDVCCTIYIYKLGKGEDQICCLCREDLETAEHILCECLLSVVLDINPSADGF